MTVANQQDQLATVQAQLTELQAKRQLDLNLCHVGENRRFVQPGAM
jgi:hypothetical protein